MPVNLMEILWRDLRAGRLPNAVNTCRSGATWAKGIAGPIRNLAARGLIGKV